MVAAGAGLRSGLAGELLASAWRLRWGAPELSLIFAERAAQLAESDAAARLAADAMAVHAHDHLGQGVRVTVRGVDALRGAEQLGVDEIGWRLRIDLAATARVIGAPLVGYALLRPVLTADVPQGIRADGLLRLVDCLAHLGPAPELDRAAWEGDRTYATDPSADQDSVALHRARLAVVVASAYRRWGDRPAAERQARAGLEFLAALRDSGADSGRIGLMLTSELVLTLLDADRPGPAAELAESVLAEPVRAPSAAEAGWLRVVLATRVHLPAGRHQLATNLLREAVELGERHDQAAVQAAGLLALAQCLEAAGDVVDALECLRTGFAAERRWQWAVHAARVCFAEEFPGANRQPSDWRAELAALVAGVSGSSHSGLRAANPAPASLPVAEPSPAPTLVAEPLPAGPAIPEPVGPVPVTSEPAHVDPKVAPPRENPLDASAASEGAVANAYRPDPGTFDQHDLGTSAAQPTGTTATLSAEDTYPNLIPVAAPVAAFIDDHPTEPIPVIRELADAPIGRRSPNYRAATGGNADTQSSEAELRDPAEPRPARHDKHSDHGDHAGRPRLDELTSSDGVSHAENPDTDPRNFGEGFDHIERSDTVESVHPERFAHTDGPDTLRPKRFAADAAVESAADQPTFEGQSAGADRTGYVEDGERVGGPTGPTRQGPELTEDTDPGSGRHRGTVGESGRDALAEAVALAATRPSGRRRAAEPTDDPVSEPGPTETTFDVEPTASSRANHDGSALRGEGTVEAGQSGMDLGWRQRSAEYDVTGGSNEAPEPVDDDHGEPAEQSSSIARVIAEDVDAAINLSHASTRLDPGIRDAWLAAAAEPRGLIMFPPDARFPGDPMPEPGPTRHNEPTNGASTPPAAPTAARRRSRTAPDHAVHLPSTAPNPSSPATNPEPTTQPAPITDDPAATTHHTEPTTGETPLAVHEPASTPHLAEPANNAEPRRSAEAAHSEAQYAETSRAETPYGEARNSETPNPETSDLPEPAEPPAYTDSRTRARPTAESAEPHTESAESAEPHTESAEASTARTAGPGRYRIPRPSERTTEPYAGTNVDQAGHPNFRTVPEPFLGTTPPHAPDRAGPVDPVAPKPSAPQPIDQPIDPAADTVRPVAAVTATAERTAASAASTATAEPAVTTEPTATTAPTGASAAPAVTTAEPAVTTEPTATEPTATAAPAATTEPASTAGPTAATAEPTATAAPAATATTEPTATTDLAGTTAESSPNGTSPQPDDPEARPGTARRSRRNGARKSFTADGPGIADLLAEALIAYETGRRSAHPKPGAASHHVPNAMGQPTPAYPTTPYQAAAALDQHPNRISEPVGKVNPWPEPATSLDATPTAQRPPDPATDAPTDPPTDPATDPFPAQLTASVTHRSDDVHPRTAPQPSPAHQPSTGVQTVAGPRPDPAHDTYAAPWADSRHPAEPGLDYQPGRQRTAEIQPETPTADTSPRPSATAESLTAQPKTHPRLDPAPAAESDTNSRSDTASSPHSAPPSRRARRRAASEPDVPERSYRIPHHLPSEYDEPPLGRHGARTPDAQPEFVVDSIDGAESAVIGPPGADRKPAASEPDQPPNAEPRRAKRTLDESRMLDLPAEQVWTPPGKRTW